jgi:antitoxin component YwqK of YwqJK toxin-antitoxin module
MRLIIFNIFLFICCDVFSQEPKLKTINYKNGNKKAEGYFLDTLKHGLWTEYYDNGKKWIEGYYKHGKMDSLWLTWFADGVLKSKINTVNGPTEMYFHNGQVFG